MELHSTGSYVVWPLNDKGLAWLRTCMAEDWPEDFVAIASENIDDFISAARTAGLLVVRHAKT